MALFLPLFFICILHLFLNIWSWCGSDTHVMISRFNQVWSCLAASVASPDIHQCRMGMGSLCVKCAVIYLQAPIRSLFRSFLMTSDIWKVFGSLLCHGGQISSPLMSCCVLPVVIAAGLNWSQNCTLNIQFMCAFVSLSKLVGRPQGNAWGLLSGFLHVLDSLQPSFSNGPQLQVNPQVKVTHKYIHGHTVEF